MTEANDNELDLTLMLAFLSSWQEKHAEGPRFWKGFRFEVLDELEERGLITQSRGAKSAYLTEEGGRRAKELLAAHGFADTSG